MTDETKKNENTNDPNCATHETASLNSAIQKNPTHAFCSSHCRVCASINLPAIHKLRSDGLTLLQLSEEIKKRFGENFSKYALHRHFKKFKTTTLAVSAEKMLQEFDEKTQTLSLHQKQTLFLMDKSFKKIMELVEAGALVPTIQEWLLLQKHYYQILQDPEHGLHDDVVAIFQRAAEKHGFSLDQAVLFKSSKATSQ